MTVMSTPLPMTRSLAPSASYSVTALPRPHFDNSDPELYAMQNCVINRLSVPRWSSLTELISRIS